MLRATIYSYTKRDLHVKRKRKKKELCWIRKIQKEKAIKSGYQLSRESQLYPWGQKGDILNINDYAKGHPFVTKKGKKEKKKEAKPSQASQL